MTPYQYAANNPTLFIDVNGDSVAVFRQADGRFVEFRDDGKEGWSGVIISTDQDDNEVVSSTFEFNDSEVDVLAIKNKVITNVEVVSDEKIDSFMDFSGVKDPQNKGILYALNEGKGGKKMDYAVEGAVSRDLNKNTFYIRKGTAFNIADFGNYLFGMGSAHLGIALDIVKLGANYNHISNGRDGKDKIPLFDFGPGTYGPPGAFDSAADQRAINKGYFEVSGRKTKNETKTVQEKFTRLKLGGL